MEAEVQREVQAVCGREELRVLLLPDAAREPGGVRGVVQERTAVEGALPFLQEEEPVRLALQQLSVLVLS